MGKILGVIYMFNIQTLCFHLRIYSVSILLGSLNHIFTDEEMEAPVKCLDCKMPRL